MKALIIAAGQGNRLRNFPEDLPKPLYKVAGVTLIERAMLSAKRAGITEFVIVTGFQGEVLQKKLEPRQKKLGVTIEFVHNPDWQKPNGHSVLKAKEYLKETFLLMMSDHVFDWKILEGFFKVKPREGEIVLAVDERINTIFDLDDATKVDAQDGLIKNIGKEISQYNAIDTGLFLCSTGLFDALEVACRDGKGSLSEAIQFLTREKRARIHRIGNYFWQDVDTPETLEYATKMLFRAVVKDTDGVISKNLNRKVSGFISRFLVKLPVTPNQITFSALVVGLLSGYFVSLGSYWGVALGGFLFQFASIYDGCDGEVSKLKLASSKLGEWLDTLCDNITYAVFIAGVVVGLYRQGFAYLMPFGFAAGFGLVMTLGLMFYYLRKYTDSGSLVTIQKEFGHDLRALSDHEPHWFIRFIDKVKFMIKRDFFALFFMFLCFMNQLSTLLIMTAVGVNVAWVVLLTMKREFIGSKSRPEITAKS